MPRFPSSAPTATRATGQEAAARDDLPQRVEMPSLGDFVYKYQQVVDLLRKLVEVHNLDMEWTERDRFELSTPLRKLAAAADEIRVSIEQNTAGLASEASRRQNADEDLQDAIDALQAAVDAIPISTVSSVFGRTADVSAQAGDYDADAITETVTRVFMTPSEQSKLAGIEAGAEVNPDASEIKTLYESNDDTNEFSDAEQTALDLLSSALLSIGHYLTADGYTYTFADGTTLAFNLFTGDYASTTITSDTTLDSTHNVVYINASSNTVDITLPPAANFANLRPFILKAIDATYTITIVGTVDGYTDPEIKYKNTAVKIQSDGTNWNFIT